MRVNGKWCLALLALCLLSHRTWGQASFANEETNSSSGKTEAFHTLRGQHIKLVTDLPVDRRLEQLPALFDAAMPQWCEQFEVPLSKVADWRVTAYVMRTRERFEAAGLIPEHLPDFPYGFQYGNEVWVEEQPSEYYRRHLLLHEGTHWFMNRHYGQNGPPWLMEGMAELLATHRWDGQRLSMGVIPATRDEVPYWGRISLIQTQLANGVAPTIETILRYDNRAHRQVEAYAWSWAVVLFLNNHPQTKDAFRQLFQRPMRPDATLTRWLFGRLRAEWPAMRAEWQAMLTDLEYGFDPQVGMLKLSDTPRELTSTVTLSIDAHRGWQASEVWVEAGQGIQITADGDVVLRRTSKPWVSFAEGVTLEYYRGRPLGKLMATIVSPQAKERDVSQPIEVIPLGAEHRWEAAVSGELHFRLNESTAELGDNQGTLRVTIDP